MNKFLIICILMTAMYAAVLEYNTRKYGTGTYVKSNDKEEVIEIKHYIKRKE